MKAYLDLCRNTLQKGVMRDTGKSTPSMGIFGGMDFVHDMDDGFPLLTTKKMSLLSIEAELIGFLRGNTNVKDFQQLGCNVWNADEEKEQWRANPHRRCEGDLGPTYGEQWRKYEHIRIIEDNSMFALQSAMALRADGYKIMATYLNANDVKCYVMRKEIDQLQRLIDGIKDNPYGRRHVVSAWNPGELDKVALPACHSMFQCYARADGYLDLKMYQRAADVGLGIPYNIASYAMLLHLLAMLTDLKPGRLTITYGDIHIYKDHLAAIWTQLSREPMPLPEITLRRISSLDEVETGIFQLHGYESHPALKMKMST